MRNPPYFFATLLMASTAMAADIPVTPGQSIQLAINGASTSDRILLSPGTYFEKIDYQGKAISIIGIGGAAQTLISGGGTEGPLVTFANDEGPDSWLQGVSVVDGYHQGLGCGIVSMPSVFGAPSPTPTVTDCIIANNRSSGGGAGVFGDAILRRCVIRDNEAFGGGNGGGVLTGSLISHCVIANNRTVNGRGGGVAGSGTIRHCLIANNFSGLSNTTGGGGIYADGLLTVQNSVIVGNHVAQGASPRSAAASASSSTLPRRKSRTV